MIFRRGLSERFSIGRQQPVICDISRSLRNSHPGKERDYLTSSPDGEGQVNKTVGLGIAYTPALLPDNTSLLLINGLTNDLKWQGSTLAETIVIKQVDIPKN